MKASFKFLTFLIWVSIGISCKQKQPKYTSPAEYNLENPYLYKLAEELDEISGLFYYTKDTSVFAINDENGRLYKIYLRNPVQVMNWRFDDGADFEDISIVDSVFYALKSSGGITSFKIPSKDSVFIDKWKRPFAEKNEFEILYYDSAYRKLILICKDCKEDNKETVTAYSFDPFTKQYSDTPVYKLDVKKIDDILGVGKEKFKPSAAAIHPITHELYIISSVNKALVVADMQGNIKSASALNPKIFKQPEGLTFTPNGNLLISNESADIGPANIMLFKYKSKAK